MKMVFHNSPKGNGLTRRSMIKALGGWGVVAVGLMAGTGCERKPRRKIVSFAGLPEYMKPGQPLIYASTWMEGAFPYGMTVTTVDGRPIRVDGNPRHPINGGASNAQMQSTVMALYDPDRLLKPIVDDRTVTWDEVDQLVIDGLKQAKRVVLVTRATIGRTERELIDAFKAAAPSVRHVVYESANDALRRKAQTAFYGEDGELIARYDRAKVILSVDSDFLATDGPTIEAMRQFAGRRTPNDQTEPVRLWVMEPSMTLTGANADHRLALHGANLQAALDHLEALIHSSEPDTSSVPEPLLQKHGTELRALASDLKTAGSESLIVAGPNQPDAIHAAVARINATLGNLGHTLFWNPSPASLPLTPDSEIESLLAESPDMILCLGVNLVDQSGDPQVAQWLRDAKLSIGHSLYHDETLAACRLKLPSAHHLESWNDAEPRPGLTSICQPVIAPFHQTRQEAESLLLWLKGITDAAHAFQNVDDWHDAVRRRWREDVYATINTPETFERFWDAALQDGLYDRGIPLQAPPSLNALAARATAPTPPPGAALVVRPHFAIHDGRFANRPWLQELADPIRKIVWDNFAVMNVPPDQQIPEAGAMLITLHTDSGSVELPLVHDPASAPDTITITLGHGRTRAGRFGDGVGAHVASLIPWGKQTGALRYSIAPTSAHVSLVSLQAVDDLHDRPLCVEVTAETLKHDPEAVHHQLHAPESAPIHEAFDYTPRNRWGLAIDLSRCTGCGHCVVACQAENNVPPVGKDQCRRGREMHWIRIDRYNQGSAETPRWRFIPILCQHCENAPCENVCPVAATTHSPEGLNEMTYNRCVGTRYCANNCPFKVRRFNFFDYPQKAYGKNRSTLEREVLDRIRYTEDSVTDDHKNRQRLAFNPQVTVRSIGIMEKCTFCVQRITAARFQSKRDGLRVIPDSRLKTACQQACPAGAIVFGDLNDLSSQMFKQSEDHRTYQALPELNLGNRVFYLAKVTRPHPELQDEDNGSHQQGSHH